MSSMNLLRAHFAWRNIAGLICLVGFFAVFFQQQGDGLPDQRAFDRETWLAVLADPGPLEEYNRPAEYGPNVRAQMVIDVLENVLRREMTREDVEAQLGPPDVRAWSTRFPRNGWRIGMWDIERHEQSQALVVSYDNADRLTAARVAGIGAEGNRGEQTQASWSTASGMGRSRD